MKTLITGASSGIGREIAVVLAERGCELILCARNKEKLDALAATLGVPVRVIALDLSVPENCFRLYELVKNDAIDTLVNNAGFGVFGAFSETSLDEELNLIQLNICAPHILTKLFLRDFRSRGNGRILNVSSVAGFFAGPMLSSYYASKNYVTQFSAAIAEELRRERSEVTISVLCPGPVATGFNERAGVRFSFGSASARDTAKSAVHGMLRGKLFIVPAFSFRVLVFLSRFLPRRLVAAIIFIAQHKKAARAGD